MDNFFKVSNHDEAEIFAFEELKADIQLEIEKILIDNKISRKDLAKRMNCSPAWVSQALGDDANLTLESVSKIFLALGRRCTLETAPLDFDIAGYDNCADITLDKEWRVSSPETWHEELTATLKPTPQADAFSAQVICMMTRKKNLQHPITFEHTTNATDETHITQKTRTAGNYSGN